MELGDYLRMLRRGWVTIVVVTLLGVVVASLYLRVTPGRYEASALLLVSPAEAANLGDLQAGSQFAMSSAATLADVVDSGAVLEGAAERLGAGLTGADLEPVTSTGAREATSLIDVVASADTAAEAARITNAIADSAVEELPSVVASASGPNQVLVQVQVVRAASPPAGPVSPDSARILVLGLVLGLALGLVLAIARQTIDTRLRRSDQLVELTGLPVLASVPRAGRQHRDGIVVRDDPRHVAVEAYRSLRTNVMFPRAGTANSLLFTAAVDDRLGAEVPVNLAWSVAESGRRVLLLDLDLRNTSVSDLLDLDRRPGMAEVLDGRADFVQAVQRSEQPDLDVVTAGSIRHRSPSDLLSSSRLGEALQEAERRYAVVIIHAPPLLGFTDAAVIAASAGRTVVTVASRRTRSPELVTALETLGHVRVEPVGLVLAGLRRLPGGRRPRRTPGGRRTRRLLASPRLVQPADDAGDGTPRLRASSE